MKSRVKRILLFATNGTSEFEKGVYVKSVRLSGRLTVSSGPWTFQTMNVECRERIQKTPWIPYEGLFTFNSRPV